MNEREPKDVPLMAYGHSSPERTTITEIVSVVTNEVLKKLQEELAKAGPGDIVRLPEGIDPSQIMQYKPPLAYVKLNVEAAVPYLAYGESAAYDLSACLLREDGRPNTAILPPRNTKAIPTGLALRPPPGHLILICSRSGMALERSIFVANSPGVVDPTYTGEIKVLLYNGGFETYYVKHGDRIAQALVVPYAALPLKEEEALPPTTRGSRGFGSSG